MIRRAFTMRLKPDSLGEYKTHHDNIWPELVAEIERSGIASITTFQRELDLFLVSEIEDEAAWDRLWSSAIHKRWAEVMEPLMHLREDGIVDSGELTEVFHLTTRGHGNRQVALSAVAVTEPPSEANMQMNFESTADSGPAASSGLALDVPGSYDPDTTLRSPGHSAMSSEYDASPEAAALPLPPDEPTIAPPNEPTPAPPNQPRRKTATRRGKKKAAKKTVKKQAAKTKPAKKAKRPTARAAAKRTRKPAKKKGAVKKAQAKKKPASKKSAKKKAARKTKQAVKKKAAKRTVKKRRK